MSKVYECLLQFIMSCQDLYLWKDPVKTGVVYGSVLVALISICYFSLISVVSYTSLFLLVGVICVKVGVYVAVTFMKKEVTNPILKYSGVDLTVPTDKVTDCAKCGAEKFNCAVTELRRLFLVENMIDSVKFGLCLWLMTYIGSWFNMMTLIILTWVGFFTIPKIYVNNKAAIDPILQKVNAQLEDLKTMAKNALPGAKSEIKKED